MAVTVRCGGCDACFYCERKGFAGERQPDPAIAVIESLFRFEERATVISIAVLAGMTGFRRHAW